MTNVPFNIAKLQECRNFAIAKEGLCLSKFYKNNRTKMLWECNNKHQWRTTWSSIKNINTWCPFCIGLSKPSINELQDFAKYKNGKLISTEYVNTQTNLLWECEHKHQWQAVWNSIKNHNTWCPYCSEQVKPEMKELQNFALNKNGLLLSLEYKTNKTNLLWQCSKGHQWEATWNNIKSRNTWCPECKNWKTEKLCKELLEKQLEIKFEKKRFYYNGHKFLEFDGYNQKNNIAFEYHGYQHYIYPNRWCKTIEEFSEHKKRDDLKEQFAAENNIKLIIIPYTEEDNLEKYITKILGEYE